MGRSRQLELDRSGLEGVSTSLKKETDFPQLLCREDQVGELRAVRPELPSINFGGCEDGLASVGVLHEDSIQGRGKKHEV